MKKLICGVLGGLVIANTGFTVLSDQVSQQKSFDRFDKGIFWSISKDGEVLGHIFGTFHSNDKRILDIPENVVQTLNAAKSFSMENFPGSRYFNPHWGFRSIVRDMTLPDGQTLASIIGDDLYKKVVKILDNVDVKEERIRHLYPWAVMNELSVRKIISQKQVSGKILDHELFDIAQGKDLYQVENLEELMAAYDDFPMDAQISLLKDRVNAYEHLHKISEKMVDSYLDEDLNKLLSLSIDFISDTSLKQGYDTVYLKNVLQERNYVMAHHMLAPLRRKHAFISVGALHLVGEQGVLKLLENYGFSLTRIKLKT